MTMSPAATRAAERAVLSELTRAALTGVRCRAWCIVSTGMILREGGPGYYTPVRAMCVAVLRSGQFN